MSIKTRVLIVDDSEEFCTGLETEIQTITSDLEVVGFAHDGREALGKIITLEPDVVLLDIVMPVMDGLGVIEMLNGMEHAYRPRIIIVSILRNDVIVQKAMELGADFFISKTIAARDLVRRMFDILRTRDNPVALCPRKKTEIIEERPLPANDIETQVRTTLQQLGMPAHLLGYKYLKDAIIMSLHDHSALEGVTKKIYPEIASRYDTTSARVERSMRHSIEVAWIKGDIDALNHYFGYTVSAEKGKPTNSEFIAMMSDRIAMKLARQV